MRVPTARGRASSLLLLMHAVTVAASFLPLRIHRGTPSLLPEDLLRHSAASTNSLRASLPLTIHASMQRHRGVSRQLQQTFRVATGTARSNEVGTCKNDTLFAFCSPGAMRLLTRKAVAARAAAIRQAVPLTPFSSVLTPSWLQHQQQSSVRAYAANGCSSNSLVTSTISGTALSTTMEGKQRCQYSSSTFTNSMSSNAQHLHDFRILEGILYPSSQAGTSRHQNDTGSVGPLPAAPAADAAAGGRGRVILLVLNQPLPPYFNCLLQSASLIVAADGAANHLLHVYSSAESSLRQQHLPLHVRQCDFSEPLPEGALQQHRYGAPEPAGPRTDLAAGLSLGADVRAPPLPACICGDIDSSNSEALSFFEARGVPVIKIDDQETTDLEKTFAFAAEQYCFSPADTLLIVGAIGGRFDHSIASISFLYKIHKAGNTKNSPLPKVVLLGGNNACFLLEEGENEIVLSDAVFTAACGLLPIGGKIRSVKSSGLQWNVKGESLCIGGLISSSNKRTSNRIKVFTTDSLLFFCELNSSLRE